MSNEHPVENLMKSTMENLKDMIDVNTVIGEAVETRDGSYIIPISKVTFGFASGGSEFGNQCKPSPDQNNTYDRIVDSVPQIIDMIKGCFNHDKKKVQDKNLDVENNPCDSNQCDDSDSSSNNLF